MYTVQRLVRHDCHVEINRIEALSYVLTAKVLRKFLGEQFQPNSMRFLNKPACDEVAKLIDFGRTWMCQVTTLFCFL